MSNQKVYPTAPDFDFTNDQINNKPISQAPVNFIPPLNQQGYVPKSINDNFIPPPITNHNQPNQEPMFYIQPYPNPPANYPPPSYQAPNYRPPNHQSPNYQSPNYQPPNYQMPNYQMPNYQMPNYPPANYQQPLNQAPMYKFQTTNSNLNPGPINPTGYYSTAKPTQTVLVDRNAFDSGARFNLGASQVMPPCPPGCLPTKHQIAVANGQKVVLGKKKANFFTGK